MYNTFEEQEREPTKALLVAVYDDQRSVDHSHEMLAELEELVRTSDGAIAEKMAVRIRGTQARLLMGRGKADEIVARAGLPPDDARPPRSVACRRC